MILSPIVLLSAFDYPNEYRTTTYLCVRCSVNAEASVLYFFSFIKLKETEQKGKFPSANKYGKKLANYLRQQRFLIDNGIQKKFCPSCKESLIYDRDASNVKGQVKVRSYFHFDCKNDQEHNKVFFFTSQKIENIIVNRVIIG